MRIPIVVFSLILVFVAPSIAEEPSLATVSPPSWFIDREDQTVMLLLEGFGLERDAKVSFRPDSVRVSKVEPGRDNQSLFVEAVIPKNAKAADLELTVETAGSTLSYPWKLLPKPERRFAPSVLEN